MASITLKFNGKSKKAQQMIDELLKSGLFTVSDADKNTKNRLNKEIVLGDPIPEDVLKSSKQ